MAPIFAFDAAELYKTAQYPKDPKVLAKVQQAMAGKKVPKALADEFIEKVKAYSFVSMTNELNRYVNKNIKGKDLTPNPQSGAQRRIAEVIQGPQAKFLMAKFDLSVHIKGGKLQLWHTDCKGAKDILVTVPS